MKYLYFIFFTLFLNQSLFAQEEKKALLLPFNSLSQKKSDLYIPSIFTSGKKEAVAKVLIDSFGIVRAGLVDGSGKFIVKPVYKQFGKFEYGYIPLLKQDYKVDFYSISSRQLFEESSDEFQIVSAEIIFTSDNYKWGALIKQENQVKRIPRQYKQIDFDSSSQTINATNFDSWKVMARDIDYVSEKPYFYDSLRFIDEEHFMFFRNGKKGEANFKEEIVAAGEFIFEEPLETKCNWVEKFNGTREEKLLYSVGLFVRDSTGKIVIPYKESKYQTYERIGEGLIKIKKENYYGVIDSTFKELIPPQYDSLRGPFSDDKIIIAYKGKLVSIFDESGNILSEPQERTGKIYDFKEGRARFVKSGYIGFIDIRGNTRVAPQYKEIRDFNECLSAVVLKGKWGFIDKDENIIVQPLYDEVKDFTNGIAAVRKSKQWFFLDKKGERTSVSHYDSVRYMSNGKWLIFRSGKIGLVSASGKELLAPRYDALSDVAEEEKVIVEKTGKWGVVDYSENFIISLKYDQVRYSLPLKKFLVMEKGKEETISAPVELRK